MKTLILLIVIAGLGACTNREIYHAVQTNQKNECEKLSGVQREDCLRHLAPDYQTYEQERQAINKR